MTIKEIAEKYDMPYHTVYNATYGIDTVQGIIRDKEYPEQEVIRSVRFILKERITKYTNKIAEMQNILDRINEDGSKR